MTSYLFLSHFGQIEGVPHFPGGADGARWNPMESRWREGGAHLDHINPMRRPIGPSKRRVGPHLAPF